MGVSWAQMQEAGPPIGTVLSRKPLLEEFENMLEVGASGFSVCLSILAWNSTYTVSFPCSFLSNNYN